MRTQMTKNFGARRSRPITFADGAETASLLSAQLSSASDVRSATFLSLFIGQKCADLSALSLI
jgi:hypothetical protein